jgi:hypothetical protein
MKSVLRIRIYLERIRNTGTGTNISFRLINTNEISVADPHYLERIRNTGTGTNISFRLINTNEISVADPDLCGADPQHRYRY